MEVRIESKAKPCPGVERAISLAEEALRRDEKLYSVGQLIHNRREVERLHRLGLQCVSANTLLEQFSEDDVSTSNFLVRAHGESEEFLDQVKACGFRVIDATCHIVRHSQELVRQHVKEGWRIIIVGNKKHAEVIGLVTRAQGYGVVISSREEAENQEFEERSLLLAQTTVDPELFSEVRHVLSGKLSELKIADTTCRFLRTRQKDITAFSQKQDIMLIVGGKRSANCRLLYETSLKHNEKSYRLESPEDIDWNWFHDGERVGLSGGASTPRWQLEEMRAYLNNPQNNIKNHSGKNVWQRILNLFENIKVRINRLIKIPVRGKK